MIANVEQRALPGGRSVFVPPDHIVRDLSAYEVAMIPDDTTARAFVEAHHYSGSYPAARERGGLYHHGRLVGVAVASQPMADAVLAALPGSAAEARELGRFVLAFDGAAPFNLSSWFLTQWSALLLREHGVRGLVSFSDPVPRTDVHGSTVFKGHIGTLYAAVNAAYAKRGTPRTLRLLPDGSVLSARALSKIRKQERGHAYAEAILVSHGAAPRGTQDPSAWLQEWLPRLTRCMRHPGNYRYLIGLDKLMRKAIRKSIETQYGALLPYPKVLITPAQQRSARGVHA